MLLIPSFHVQHVFLQILLKVILFKSIRKEGHSTTQQEEQLVTWNTQAQRSDHTLKINNRNHDNRSTALSSTVILNI
jgi:hypothetical protein